MLHSKRFDTGSGPGLIHEDNSKGVRTRRELYRSIERSATAPAQLQSLPTIELVQITSDLNDPCCSK